MDGDELYPAPSSSYGIQSPKRSHSEPDRNSKSRRGSNSTDFDRQNPNLIGLKRKSSSDAKERNLKKTMPQKPLIKVAPNF